MNTTCEWEVTGVERVDAKARKDAEHSLKAYNGYVTMDVRGPLDPVVFTAHRGVAIAFAATIRF
jgi:hypothetical protein